MTAECNILDINDQAITALTAEGTVVSPGYALYQDKWITLGTEAEQNARLFPRASHNQFWQQLSLDKLQNASPLVGHTADLVYHQLKQLFNNAQTAPLTLLVPSYLSSEQISLLLGICDSLELNTQAVIDSAMMACSNQPEGNYWYIDLHLHQCLISEIAITDQIITKKQTVVLANSGINQLKEAWIQAISDEFIQQTRFNPRHTGEHEQALYNQLPQWLTALKQGETQLQITDKSITIGFNLLAQVSKRFLEPIEQALTDYEMSAPRSTVLLSPHSHWLNAISSQFEQWPIVEQNTIFNQARAYLPILTNNGNADGVLFPEHLPRLKHLGGESAQPASTGLNETAHSTTTNPITGPTTHSITKIPTHLLIDNTAYPIDVSWVSADRTQPVTQRPQPNSFCKLYTEANQLILEPLTEECTLNNEALAKRNTIHIGDNLICDGFEYRFIEVVAHGTE